MLNKLNTLLRLLVVGMLIYPMPIASAYHVDTQAPYGTNASSNQSDGTFTIGILGSDGAEDLPPDSYTIFFSLSNGVTETNSFCVTTSFGHQTNTWQYYTFSLDDLKYYFKNLPALSVYYRVRANNEANYSFSDLTQQQQHGFQSGSPFDFNQDDTWTAPTGTDACNDPKVSGAPTSSSSSSSTPPPTPDDATSVSVNYSGEDVQFSWEYTDGTVDAHSFHINYSYDNTTWERIIITDTTLRKYDLDKELTETGTFYWEFSVCGDLDNGESCTTSDSNNFQTTEWVATLGPPMNPEVSNVYDSGVRVKWDVPNTGNQTADTYELYYRTSPTDEVVVYNISTTEYTIPYANIPNGTYEFSIRAFDSDYNVYSGYSTEPTLEVFNQKAKDDADAAAEAARKAEEERIAKEKAEAEEAARNAERQANKDKWDCYMTNAQIDRGDCEPYNKWVQEEADRVAKEKAEAEEKDANFTETGYYETNAERSAREQAEYEAEQQRIAKEKDDNFSETGYYETDAERADREQAEYEAEQKRIEEEIKNTVVVVTDGEELTEEEQEELDVLVDAIIEIQETVDFTEYDVEEEIFEIEEVVIVVTTTTTTTTTIPIKEDFPDEEVIEIIETDPFPSDEGDEEIQLTDEEIEVLVTETEDKVKEIVIVEIVEEEIEEDATEDEIAAAQEEYEAAVEEVVKELPKEKKVEVVKEVAKVKVQNLATADKQTKAVVKAVVKEVTKVETVAELSEDEKKEVGKVLGFKDEETAAKDVEIVAKQAEKEPAVAEAVNEYVDRAIENKDVEGYTLADVVTEVQVENFLENPVGSLIDVDFSEITISNIGYDMTSDQKEKAQEVVVPVILASQIIAQAGALVTRRF